MRPCCSGIVERWVLHLEVDSLAAQTGHGSCQLVKEKVNLEDRLPAVLAELDKSNGTVVVEQAKFEKCVSVEPAVPQKCKTTLNTTKPGLVAVKLVSGNVCATGVSVNEPVRAYFKRTDFRTAELRAEEVELGMVKSKLASNMFWLYMAIIDEIKARTILRGGVDEMLSAFDHDVVQLHSSVLSQFGRGI